MHYRAEEQPNERKKSKLYNPSVINTDNILLQTVEVQPNLTPQNTLLYGKFGNFLTFMLINFLCVDTIIYRNFNFVSILTGKYEKKPAPSKLVCTYNFLAKMQKLSVMPRRLNLPTLTKIQEFIVLGMYDFERNWKSRFLSNSLLASSRDDLTNFFLHKRAGHTPAIVQVRRISSRFALFFT